MTDHLTKLTDRRSFLRRLLTTTSLVATGAASAPAWAQSHGAHGAHGPRVRNTARAAPAPLAAPGSHFANPPPIVGKNGDFALNVAMRQVNFNGQRISVQAYVDPNNFEQIVQPLVGPTITITGNGQPVQQVAVRLSNLLPKEPHAAPQGPVTSAMDDNPHGFNTTNLHVHGLHVAPFEDNVFIELQPAANGRSPPCTPTAPAWVCNGSYTYSYNFGKAPVSPTNQTGTTKIPAGTYWYHPHKHGSVGVQVASGMAGAFIVLGDLDEIPGVAGLPEKIMVAQMIPTATYGTETVGVVNPQFYYGIQPNPPQPAKVPNNPNQLISINGLVNPSLVMNYGEIQRWRFINATADQFFYLKVTGPSGTTAPLPELYAIAVDGVPLTNSAHIRVPFRVLPPQSLKSPRSFKDAVMNEIAILAPAQRLDLLVRLPPTAQAPAEAVTYSVQAVPYDPTNAGPLKPQNILTVIGIFNRSRNSKPDQLPHPTRFNSGALYRPPLPQDASTWPQTPTQTIQFGFLSNQINGGNTGAVVNNTTSQTPFGVSGSSPPNGSLPPAPPLGASAFALPSPAQLQLKLNAIDKWSVASANAGPHAFHIHINSFLMTQRNGQDITAARIWRDTARIDQPPQPTSPSPGVAASTGVGAGALSPIGPVEFVSQQVDYVGDFVMHCHFLEHEDSGMMWSVNIS